MSETEKKLELTPDSIYRAFKQAQNLCLQYLPEEVCRFIPDTTLKIGDYDDCWDIMWNEYGTIIVNLRKVKWYIQRYEQMRRKGYDFFPKYDLETAIAHDIFEYAWYRYLLSKQSNVRFKKGLIIMLHHKAREFENMLRERKGLGLWF